MPQSKELATKNGKINMRRIIKGSAEYNTSSYSKAMVSSEIVNAGDYNDAKKILQNCSDTED